MIKNENINRYAMLPLRDMVLFPHMVAPLFVGREKSVQAIEEAMNSGQEIFLAAQKDAKVDDPTPVDIYETGTIGTILQLLRLPDGTVKALIEGKRRGRIIQFIPEEKHFTVTVQELEEKKAVGPEIDALTRVTVAAFDDYVKLNKKIPPEVALSIASINEASRLADTIASHITLQVSDKQEVLEQLHPGRRLEKLYSLMTSESRIAEIEQRIKERVKKQMEKNQKDYYLNEQIRAIKKEMGQKEEGNSEIRELKKRIKRKRLPREAAAKVRNELKKLSLMAPMSAEATVVRNYIDWILELPWFEKTKDKHDMIRRKPYLMKTITAWKSPRNVFLNTLPYRVL